MSNGIATAVVTTLSVFLCMGLAYAEDDGALHVDVYMPRDPLVDLAQAGANGTPVYDVYSMKHPNGRVLWLDFDRDVRELRAIARGINDANHQWIARVARPFEDEVDAARHKYLAKSNPTRRDYSEYATEVGGLKTKAERVRAQWHKQIGRLEVDWQTLVLKLQRRMENHKRNLKTMTSLPDEDSERPPNAFMKGTHKGEVSRVDESGKLVPLTDDTSALGPGDYQTGEGEVRVEFPLGAVVHFAPYSQFIIEDPVDSTEGGFLTEIVISVARGAIRFTRTLEQGILEIKIRTSRAVLAVRGTDFVLEEGGDGPLVVRVVEGHVRLTPTSGGAAVDVRGGQQVEVHAHGHTLSRTSAETIKELWSQRSALSRGSGTPAAVLYGLVAALILGLLIMVRVARRRTPGAS